MHQEMDSIHTRFWTPTFFKKGKRIVSSVFGIKYIPKSQHMQYLTSSTSSEKLNMFCHLSKEKKISLSSLFWTSPPPWWGRGFQGGCSSCLSPGWHEEQPAQLVPWRAALTVCSSLTWRSLVTVSCPQWDANKISANKLFPLMGWISSPHNVCWHLPPLAPHSPPCLRTWLF